MGIPEEIEAYAHYINAPKHMFNDDHDEKMLFHEDTQKAKAAMEKAWLEAKPVKE